MQAINLIPIIILAIIVEGVITYARQIISGGKVNWPMLAAIAMGIIVAVAYSVDMLAMLGLVSPMPFIGSILTGILISRGSNYIFDLIKLVGESTAKIKGGTW